MGTTVVTLFLAFILHRFLSGVRNGMLYNPKPHAPLAPGLMGVAMAMVAVCMVAIISRQSYWPFVPVGIANMLIVGSLLLGFLCGIMALQYGKQKRIDLHLWVQLEQMALSAPLLFIGWPGIIILASAVYPAVFAQKAAINRITEESIWYNATDDATGATYGIPSLGLKIPRTTQRTRAWFALVSILSLTIIALHL